MMGRFNDSIHLCGIFLLWSTVHYISAHAYVHFCVPLSLSGLTLSPLIATTPHCVALRWCIQNGVSMIDRMWLSLGTWLTGKLVQLW